MDKDLLAGLSPAYALTQGKLPMSATLDMLQNKFGGADKVKDAEKERDDYKNQLAAMQAPRMKKGGKVKKMAKGGSASSRADGCAIKGKTKGRFV